MTSEQIVSTLFSPLQGYALFGNVVCLFLTTIGYHHSHSFFYALWLVFGGLSAAKLVSIFFIFVIIVERRLLRLRSFNTYIFIFQVK